MNKFYVLVAVIMAAAVFIGCEQKKEEQSSLESMNAVLEGVDVSSSEGDLKSSDSPIESQVAGEDTSDPNTLTETAVPATDSLDSTIHEKPTDEQIQQALTNAGLYSGDIDGKIGPKSKTAIREFQEQNGLTADGKVGPKTWEKLGPYLNQTPSVTPTAEATSYEITY